MTLDRAFKIAANRLSRKIDKEIIKEILREEGMYSNNYGHKKRRKRK